MIVSVHSRYIFFGVGLLAATLTAFGPCCARADLFVSSDSNNIVAQYDQNDGTFLSIFAQGEGLGSPRGVLIGPDGNLYVANNSGNNVLRFSATDGTFIDVFASGGE